MLRRILPSIRGRYFTTKNYHSMNRPRNRQTRPPGLNSVSATRSSAPDVNVPTIRSVFPGAKVSIVLKADQSTGREVQGTVKDLLTRGDHPRGIKVRLQDGRIGRVQRTLPGDSRGTAASATRQLNDAVQRPAQMTTTSQGDDAACEGPPSRSLADYIAGRRSARKEDAMPVKVPLTPSATVTCPVCGTFEGDESAVSHHVQTHLD